jgi:serine/threonine protein kinase
MMPSDQYPVYPNVEFDIGRRHIQSIWGETYMIISSHHLRFWCVMYESESDEKVSPMVYVRVLSSNNVQFSANLGRDHITTHALTKTDPDTLLNDGDVLHLTNKISVRFQTHAFSAVQPGNFTAEQISDLEHFDDRYLVTDRRLGIGASGSVFVAVKQSTRRQIACKIIKPSTNVQPAVPLVRDSFGAILTDANATTKDCRKSREYTVLKDLCHPNIISLEKVICTTNNTFIFQELITGGDLLSYLDKSGPLREAESAVIARQVLKAVNYLHDRGVVHRDIKPENILMTSWREGSRIVLTDFGQARTFEETKAKVRKAAALRMHSMVGTFGYTAPEVLNMETLEMTRKGYSKAVDIWSIGCLTAALLTNRSIFPDESPNFEDRASLRARHPTERWGLKIMDVGKEWKSIGRKAKSFIRGCLRLDECGRLSAKQALLHEWFTNKHYAVEIEAAYQRAIEDWVPRDLNDDVVESIDTSAATDAAKLVSADVERLEEQVRPHDLTEAQQYSLPPPPSLFFNPTAYHTPFSIQPYPLRMQLGHDDDKTQRIVGGAVGPTTTTPQKKAHLQAEPC